MGDFKFTCPHCTQHIRCDDALTGQTVPCPSCQAALVVPGTPQPLPPPRPVPRIVVAPTNRPSRNTAGNWINAALVVILAGLTPVIALFGMLITLPFGPLAFIAAPVVVIMVSKFLGQICLARAGLRWFWIYGGCTGLTFVLMIVPVFWPWELHRTGEGSLGGSIAAVGGSFAALFLIAAAVLWLIGFVAAVPDANPD